MQRRNFLLNCAQSLAITLGATILTSCDKKKQFPTLFADAKILAFGDSLTAGYGAPNNHSYPDYLASMTRWNVINAGISGNTTADALARLPDLLKKHQPDLVLTGIGGNDVLKHLPQTQMRQNIISICDQIKTAGILHMLIAMPQFSLIGAATGTLKDNPVYQEIAQTLDIPIQKNGWSTVLSQERYRSDAIHGNAQGYQYFASLLKKSLEDYGISRT